MNKIQIKQIQSPKHSSRPVSNYSANNTSKNPQDAIIKDLTTSLDLKLIKTHSRSSTQQKQMFVGRFLKDCLNPIHHLASENYQTFLTPRQLFKTINNYEPKYCLSEVNIFPCTQKHKKPEMLMTFGKKKKYYNENNLCNCSFPCYWAEKWTRLLSTKDQSLYSNLKSLPTKMSVLIQIQKDMKRTQPFNKSFQGFSTRKMLQQVLETYSKYDKELQYVQGMNLIASIILYHVKNTEQTFWVLVDLMERGQFREVYLNNFKKLSSHLEVVLKLIQQKLPRLNNHMKELQIQLDAVLTGWILSLMTTIIPIEHAHYVIDKFISKGWKSLYYAILKVMSYLEQRMIRIDDPSNLLGYFSSILRDETIQWEAIFRDGK